jgi:transaldolase
MPLFLDSADPEDARAAAATGFVHGITTNPVLLARQDQPAEELIPHLCDLVPGTVFHQLGASTVQAREDEAHHILGLRPDRIGLKIPCTYENLALACRLAGIGMTVGVTAIFSPAQVLLACEAGANYVLPYVNRSTRLQGSGPALVAEMRAAIDGLGSKTEIIAASIKTPDEAVETALAGAHHLTVPLPILRSMASHALSEQAIEAFDGAVRSGTAS